MMYGKENQMAQCEAEFKGPSWDIAFEVMERLTTSDLDDVEPFGFRDGLSQPVVDWEEKRKISGDQLVYSNVVSLGEFLLGYSNEYNEYTDRPLLDPTSRGVGPTIQKRLRPQWHLTRHSPTGAGRARVLAVHGPGREFESGTANTRGRSDAGPSVERYAADAATKQANRRCRQR
jgi:hypothetical protein